MFSPLWLLVAFYPFLPVHVLWGESGQRRRGWTITFLRSLGKPSVPQPRELFSASPPFSPHSKTECNEKVRNTQFLCKVIFVPHTGKAVLLALWIEIKPWLAGSRGAGEVGLRWPWMQGSGMSTVYVFCWLVPATLILLVMGNEMAVASFNTCLGGPSITIFIISLSYCEYQIISLREITPGEYYSSESKPLLRLLRKLKFSKAYFPEVSDEPPDLRRLRLGIGGSTALFASWSQLADYRISRELSNYFFFNDNCFNHIL